MTRSEYTRALASITATLGPIELQVLVAIAKRLREGQETYGKFRTGDKRNWIGEAFAEACDQAVYLAMAGDQDD